MERMNSKEIIKVIDNLIGNTEPVADSILDEAAAHNLTTLIDVTDWMISQMMQTAAHSRSPYASQRKVGLLAYDALVDFSDTLGDYITIQEAENGA